MTKGQVKTARAIGCLMSGFVGLIVTALGWEFYAITLHDHATISEVTWIAFAAQPGPIAIVLVVVALLFGALVGHLLWQNSGLYDSVRKEREQ